MISEQQLRSLLGSPWFPIFTSGGQLRENQWVDGRGLDFFSLVIQAKSLVHIQVDINERRQEEKCVLCFEEIATIDAANSDKRINPKLRAIDLGDLAESTLLRFSENGPVRVEVGLTIGDDTNDQAKTESDSWVTWCLFETGNHRLLLTPNSVVPGNLLMLFGAEEIDVARKRAFANSSITLSAS